jgi:hypothetical protein
MLTHRAAAAVQHDTPRAVAKAPPEQDLFLSVIAVAVQDYRGRMLAPGNSHKPALSASQKQAEAWLFSPLYEQDFFTVCSFAGVDPEFVREVARRNRRLAWSRS